MAKGLAKFIHYNEGSLHIEVLFDIFYITGVKKFVRYTENFAI